MQFKEKIEVELKKLFSAPIEITYYAYYKPTDIATGQDSEFMLLQQGKHKPNDFILLDQQGIRLDRTINQLLTQYTQWARKLPVLSLEDLIWEEYKFWRKHN